MSKNTSILLGDYYDKFISKEVSSGKYSTASEVVRTALRLLESEESKLNTLRKELKKGEKSGIIENFNREKNLKQLHEKYAK